MKLPAHIIEEKRRREQDKRQREEHVSRLPISPPIEDCEENRYKRKDRPKKGMIEIEL